MLRRLIGAVVAAIAATLALAGPAFARSADITSAEVALRLAPDGALLVTERLTFEYDGHFEGSYRDINLNFGERITDVQVSQDGQQFEPGGNTGLGSFDRPGVFGTVDLGDRYRIVWHYRATDETRTHHALLPGRGRGDRLRGHPRRHLGRLGGAVGVRPRPPRRRASPTRRSTPATPCTGSGATSSRTRASSRGSRARPRASGARRRSRPRTCRPGPRSSSG